MPDEGKTSLERRLLLAGGILTAISGLVATASGLVKGLRDSVGLFSGIKDDPVLWTIGVALLGLGLWLVLLARRRRSILLRPEALRLTRSNPSHLFGRETDIEQLARLCREQPLVFLEGQSGSGKSALLQAGLVATLRDDALLLPIYVDSLVGADWEREPRRFLAAALWSALDEAGRSVLELKSPPHADTVFVAAKAIRGRLGRTPLVILDQFDDYQTRHLRRFLQRKIWLRPDKLVEQNSFWRDLSDLADHGDAHLLIVTRTDTAGGLTSVRFVEPETYSLDRLAEQFVGPLLAELAKGKSDQSVISDPEFGWTRLSDRLAADLGSAGTVLPQQLKIVLAGLETLPGRILTVAAYERAGGTKGLEARFIESRIAKVSRLCGVPEERLRAALLSFVDPANPNKTVERGIDEVAAHTGLTEQQLESALVQFEQEEVLRRRPIPEEGKIRKHQSSWLLDHDYLTGAVREADRKANRWQWTLAEGARSLTAAGTNWKLWWRALLQPGTQLAFLRDRTRGRFRYGAYRSYAMKCLLRFSPYAAVLLLIAGLGLYERERRNELRIQDAANDFLNKLDRESDITSEEANALLDLAASEWPVREGVLELLLTNPDRNALFQANPEPLIRAIVGVSPELRQLAIASMAGAIADYPPAELRRTFDRVASLLELGITFPLEWSALTVSEPIYLEPIEERAQTPQERSSAATAIVQAIENTVEFDALETLGQSLAVVASGLDEEGAKAAMQQILSAISTAPDAYVLASLGEGLAPLASRLEATQIRDVLRDILAAINRTNGRTVPLNVLGQSLWAIGNGLRPVEAEDAAELVLSAVKSNTDDAAQIPLVTGLSALAGNLQNPNLAKDASDVILATIEIATNSTALPDLGKGLEEATARLPPAEAKEVAGAILLAVEATTDPDTRLALVPGLVVVADKLDSDQRESARAITVSAIDEATDAVTVSTFGGLLLRLSSQRSKEVQILDIIYLSHHPLCDQNFLEQLLLRLNAIAGVEFVGLWSAVEWAEEEQRMGRLNGLNLDDPRPGGGQGE